LFTYASNSFSSFTTALSGTRVLSSRTTCTTPCTVVSRPANIFWTSASVIGTNSLAVTIPIELICLDSIFTSPPSLITSAASVSGATPASTAQVTDQTIPLII
jgi:hypothetical protein